VAAGVEIERKFRLDREPDWLRDCESDRIEQGYLAIEPGSAEVRVRRRGERSVLTVKRGAGLTRDEAELDLAPEQFESLWPLTEGRRVSKVRYLVPRGDATIEVDVFEGALAGTCVGEIEFDSESESDAFDPPEWLGEEVTGDSRYANQSLAVNGLPDERR
jgi:CYTH domain-containing protein